MLRRFRILRILVVLSLAVLGIAGLTAPVRAQTGLSLIKGTVIDAETGELLDYANVIIKGTTRGTMSLGGGAFYFRDLAPGTYTIQVLYLGYEPNEQTVTVTAGETKTIDFRMKVTIVETLPEYEVDAAAYMVDVKGVKTAHDVGAEKFQQYALDSVEDALARQAGIVMRAGQLYVRGGRSGEVQFQLDGVSVDNPIGGGSLSVSTLAIENMQAVIGGLDAEYGNALSGVVNITTKTGSREKFEGGIRFLTDDYGRQDRTFTNLDRFEYGFGGPSPIKNLTYYLSGDLVWSDNENYSVADRPEYSVNFGDKSLFKFRRRQANSAKGSAKLAYYFDEESKKVLTAEYTYSASWNQFYSPNWSVEGYAQKLIYMPVVQRYAEAGGQYGDAYIYTGTQIPVYYGPWVNNMLARSHPAVVVDVRNASNIRQIVPILQVRSAADGTLKLVAAQPLFSGYRYPYSGYSTVAEDSSYVHFNSANDDRQATNFTQSMKFVWRQSLSPTTFYTVRLALVSFDNHTNVNGKDPYEYNHGGIGSPDLFTDQVAIYQNAGDYYTDRLNPLFVTTSDYPVWDEQYSRTYSLSADLTSSRWQGHLVKTGLLLVYNDLQRATLSYPAIETQNRYTQLYGLGANRNLFHTYNPEASWYLQDRWEYQGLVINFGLRWDMFSPGSAADILLRNDDVDRNVIKYKTQFSPRLGFAFPITERDGFSFYYGRFIQFPDRENLFASQQVVGNLGTLGNPNLDAMTTITFQAAIQHQFTDFLAGSFALYSKDFYDLIASVEITDTDTGNQLARYINKAYASARGIELQMNKRFSNGFGLDFAYTFAYADGVASGTDFGANPEGLAYLPSQELPLDWDVRHSASIGLYIAEPGAWNGSVDVSYNSGFPWTPVDRFARRQDPLLENSMRLPATFNVNVQFRRELNVYGQHLTLEMQGLNLLNEDRPVGAGGGVAPGLNNATTAYPQYLTETGKFGGAYLQDQNGDGFNEFIPIYDPRVFDQHRLFRVGLGWKF